MKNVFLKTKIGKNQECTSENSMFIHKVFFIACVKYNFRCSKIGTECNIFFLRIGLWH
jgi:hypothetical protein